MKKPMIFALAIVMAFSLLLFADKRQETHEMYLVTSFDFGRYPSCDAGQNANCVLAIRFYDADSHQRLAEVGTTALRGPQRIVATAKSDTTPRRVYAVTVYSDNSRARQEGPRGQTSELRLSGEGN